MIEKINGFVLIHNDKNSSMVLENGNYSTNNGIVFYPGNEKPSNINMFFAPVKAVLLVGEESSSEDPNTFVDALKLITPENIAYMVEANGIPLCIFRNGEEISLKVLRTHSRFNLTMEWSQGYPPEFTLLDKMSGIVVKIVYDEDNGMFEHDSAAYGSLYEAVIETLKDMADATKDKLDKLTDLISVF